MALFRFFPSGVQMMTGLDGRVTIEVETRQGTTTIVVRGELDLATMPFLTAQLALAVQDGPGRLVFDLSGTHFMDCGSAQLQSALNSRAIIEQAKGVLIGQQGLTAHAAYALLRARARAERRKLAIVSAEVVRHAIRADP